MEREGDKSAMTYEDAVYNALQGRCVPYKKETKSKLKELLAVAKEKDEKLGRNKMSKFNVGDKFEIEIAEVFKGAESGNDKYRIKGFDCLTFDDKGLEKMKQTVKGTNCKYKVGDIVYIPEDERCAVILWINDKLANVLYSDYMLGINMNVDRLSGVYGESDGLKKLAKEIDDETRNIDYEAQDMAEMMAGVYFEKND